MESITSEVRWAEIVRQKQGFVFNDFSGKAGSGVKYNVLHRADCFHLRKASTAVDKTYSTELREMVEWLNMFRRGNWKPCGFCCPDIRP